MGVIYVLGRGLVRYFRHLWLWFNSPRPINLQKNSINIGLPLLGAIFIHRFHPALSDIIQPQPSSGVGIFFLGGEGDVYPRSSACLFIDCFKYVSIITEVKRSIKHMHVIGLSSLVLN